MTLLSRGSLLCACESRIDGKSANSVPGVTDILEPLPLLDNSIEAVVLLLVDEDKFPIIIAGIIIVVVGVPFRCGNDSDIDNTEAGLGLGLGGPSDSVSSVSGSEEEEEAPLLLPVMEGIVIGYSEVSSGFEILRILEVKGTLLPETDEDNDAEACERDR